MTAQIKYQGFNVMNFSFRRSAGIRPDKFSIEFPADVKVQILKQEGIIAPQDYPRTGLEFPEEEDARTNKIKLNMAGDLVFEDPNTQTSITAKRIYVDDKTQDVVRQYRLKEAHKSVTKVVNLTDVRSLWEEQGFIFGDYNVIATNEKKPYELVDKQFYETQTIKVIQRGPRRIVELLSLNELIQACIGALPSGYTENKLKLKYGFGIVDGANPNLRARPAGAKRKEDEPPNPVDPKKVFPVDIRWGNGVNAAQALNTLLKRYNLILTLDMDNTVIIHQKGWGIDYIRDFRQHISNRNPGTTFQKAPPAIAVIGKRLRREIVINEWIPLLPDTEGNVFDMKVILQDWGITDRYIRDQLFLSQDQRFKSHSTRLGADATGGDEATKQLLFDKRRNILLNYAYKYFRIPNYLRNILPILPRWRWFQQPTKPGEVHGEFIVKGFFIIPQKTKQQQKGHITAKWYDNAVGEVVKIEADTGRIRTATPVGIPLLDKNVIDKTRHIFETLEEVVLKNTISNLKGKLRDVENSIKSLERQRKKHSAAVARLNNELENQRPAGPQQFGIGRGITVVIPIISSGLSFAANVLSGRQLGWEQYKDLYLKRYQELRFAELSALQGAISEEKRQKKLQDKFNKLEAELKSMSTYDAEYVMLQPTMICSYELRTNRGDDFYMFFFGNKKAVPKMIKDNNIQCYFGLTGISGSYGTPSDNQKQCDEAALELAQKELDKNIPFEVDVDEATLSGFQPILCDGKIHETSFGAIRENMTTGIKVNLPYGDEYSSRMAIESVRTRANISPY